MTSHRSDATALTSAEPPDASGLNTADRALLDFESRHWLARTRRPAKNHAIFVTYGILPTRYYQRLNTLIDTEGALAHAPLLVHALRRIREAHRQAR